MPKERKPAVKVIQDPEAPIAKEVMAKAIRDMSNGVRDLMAAGLEFEDLVVLVKKRVPATPITDIRATLEGLRQLCRDYSR